MVRLRRYPIQLTLLSAFLLLTPASTAHAQRRGRGGLRPGEVSLARLLTVEAVQNELKLSEKQKATAAEINDSLTEERHKLFKEVAKDSHERTKKVAELEERTSSKVNKLLDDSQRKRLREILVQVNGAVELTKKNIQEELGITSEQRKNLSEISHENEKARREALANYEGDKTAKMVELQREADKKLLDVLTEKQREQFEKLKGTKLSIDVFKSS
jgi:hypothetical protein